MKTTNDGEVMREIAGLTSEISETASGPGNPRFGPTGVIAYRVIVAQQGGARAAATVDAATGDEAAEKALRQYPGWKVAYVGPASDEVRLTDDLVAE